MVRHSGIPHMYNHQQLIRLWSDLFKPDREGTSLHHALHGPILDTPIQVVGLWAKLLIEWLQNLLNQLLLAVVASVGQAPYERSWLFDAEFLVVGDFALTFVLFFMLNDFVFRGIIQVLLLLYLHYCFLALLLAHLRSALNYWVRDGTLLFSLCVGVTSWLAVLYPSFVNRLKPLRFWGELVLGKLAWVLKFIGLQLMQHLEELVLVLAVSMQG